MMTLTLFSLAVLWIAVLHRYPAAFVPRKTTGLAQAGQDLGENWIEVVPDAEYHEAASMQQVA